MRILLVGTGEHGTGTLARDLAAEGGVEVQLAGDAAGAIEMLYGCDAVVTRLDLDSLDEIEVIRWLHLRRPKLPLVILSPNATVDRAVACMRAGATDFLPVTVAPGALLAVLRRAVGESLLHEQAERLRGLAGARPNGDRPPARDGDSLLPADNRAGAEPPQRAPDGVLLPPGLTLAEVERLYIAATLENFEGDYSSLAIQLGISRKTLWEKRRRLALERRRPDRGRPETRSA